MPAEPDARSEIDASVGLASRVGLRRPGAFLASGAPDQFERPLAHVNQD